MRLSRVTPIVAAAFVAAAGGAALAQSAPAAWRASEIGGQATAFVTVEPDQGSSTSTYLGFSCGAQPAVRITARVAATGVPTTPVPLSITFEAGDDLLALRLDGRFASAAAANAAEPARAEFAGERSLIEDVDAELLRDLAEFLRDAGAETVTVRSDQPAFRLTFPLREAKAVLTRFLETCPALARR